MTNGRPHGGTSPGDPSPNSPQERRSDHCRARGKLATWLGHLALLMQSLDYPAELPTCPHRSNDYEYDPEPPGLLRHLTGLNFHFGMHTFSTSSAGASASFAPRGRTNCKPGRGWSGDWLAR